MYTTSRDYKVPESDDTLDVSLPMLQETFARIDAEQNVSGGEMEQLRQQLRRLKRQALLED